MLSRLTFFSILILFVFQTPLASQTAKEIIEKSQEKIRGVETSQGSAKMTIIRPTWTREITMKSWSKGEDYSLTLITSPPRDQGTTFLKRDKEIWTFQPNIDRTIKLPPSMMMQSWMGSDFTNDDLVRESSMVNDYESTVLAKEEIDGWMCYKLEMIPHPDAPVVWGKVFIWIDEKEYMQLKVEFYDEDDYLVNTMYGKGIKELGNVLIPTVLEMVPNDEEGHKTVVEQLSLVLDQPIEERFFSIQTMKRIQ